MSRSKDSIGHDQTETDRFIDIFIKYKYGVPISTWHGFNKENLQFDKCEQRRSVGLGALT